MKLKKSIAVLMAAAMTLGAAYPAAAVTTDADAAPAAADAAAVSRIVSVKVKDQAAELTFTALQAGKAVVEICSDDAEGKVVLSGSVNIKAGDTTASVTFEKALPETFMLRAKLTSADGKSVYGTYTNPLYTKEVQDMLKVEPIDEETRAQWLAETEEAFDYTHDQTCIGLGGGVDGVSLHLPFNDDTKAKAIKHLVIPEKHTAVSTEDTTAYPVIGINVSTLSDSYDLEYVEMPDCLRVLEQGTFFHKSKLKQLIFPSDLYYIGDSALRDSDSITSLVIPSKVQRIANNAFIEMDSLESLIFLPSEAEKVDLGIQFCKSNPKLKTLKVYASWEYIPSAAFMSDTALETVILPDTMKKIYESAFSNCTSLKQLDLPDGLQEIGAAAFQGCTALESIDLPASVTTLGKSVFNQNFGNKITMTDVTIRNPEIDITNLENAFFYYTGTSADQFAKPVLHGYTGSTTEKFANEKGFKFVALDSVAPETTTAPAVTTDPATTSGTSRTVKNPDSKLCGDANQDDKVDVSDAVLVARFAVMDTTVFITDQGLANADASGDGKVSDQDITSIIMYIARRTTTLPYDPTKPTAKS